MNPDRDQGTLNVPDGASRAMQPKRKLRVLSLTGGGYRGLFTAKVLVELAKAAKCTGPLNQVFDVFAGTSIGGLMASALAVGVLPQRVLDAIDRFGPDVFPKKRQGTLRRIFFGTLYEPGNLAKAVDGALKDKANTKLKDVQTGLLLPAVDWADGSIRLFRSGWFGKAYASDITLRDACLATSAAPTYFPPHVLNGAPMLDGGLAANNPDAVVLLEILRRSPSQLSNVHMLSIGTAGVDAQRRPEAAERSGLRWADTLPVYMISVQEQSAAAQARGMLGDRYLRLNHIAPKGSPGFERLDLVDDPTRDSLMSAAAATAKSAYKAHRAFIDRMLVAAPMGSGT